MNRMIVPAKACSHDAPAQVRMPSRESGRESNAVAFGWCRECGAIWLPKLPSFDQAFSRHSVVPATCVVDGIGAVNGYWVLPGTVQIVVS